MSERPRIVCLGEALIDLTPARGQDLATASRLNARVGGAPLNVAVHLKRAGADPFYLGTLSTDSFGDRIKSTLDAKRIPHGPSRRVDAPTRIALIEDRDGQPPFRFYGNRPADTRLTLREALKHLNNGVQALYVSSLMMLDRNAARVQMEAIRLASERGDVVVVSDPNPRLSAWKSRDEMLLATERLLAHSWIIKLSLEDARILGWPDDPQALIAHLKRRTSGYAVITDGPRGCWLDSPAGVEHFSVPPVPVVDSTGAGDAFFARIVANALRDWAISPETMLQAAFEGARVAGRRGAF